MGVNMTDELRRAADDLYDSAKHFLAEASYDNFTHWTEGTFTRDTAAPLIASMVRFRRAQIEYERLTPRPRVVWQQPRIGKPEPDCEDA